MMRERDRPATPTADGQLGDGLTKREAAAIAAMQGLLAGEREHTPPDETAKSAVKRADALFDELEKGDG